MRISKLTPPGVHTPFSVVRDKRDKNANHWLTGSDWLWLRAIDGAINRAIVGVIISCMYHIIPGTWYVVLVSSGY